MTTTRTLTKDKQNIEKETINIKTNISFDMVYSFKPKENKNV